jgi:hypothetical protein
MNYLPRALFAKVNFSVAFAKISIPDAELQTIIIHHRNTGYPIPH